MPFIEDIKKFSVDYFIMKFQAIPEDQWCEGDFTDRSGRHCAHGHCGTGHCGTGNTEMFRDTNWSEESIALKSIAPHIISVNDGNYMNYPNWFEPKSDTIKGRVLEYLKAIKEGRG